jgi:hypothetical protein
MALEIVKDVGFGVEIQDIYCRVICPRINYSASSTKVQFQIWYYYNQASRTYETNTFGTDELDYPKISLLNRESKEVDISNLTISSYTVDGIKTAIYTYLKTLPEWANAEDILES